MRRVRPVARTPDWPPGARRKLHAGNRQHAGEQTDAGNQRDGGGGSHALAERSRGARYCCTAKKDTYDEQYEHGHDGQGNDAAESEKEGTYGHPRVQIALYPLAQGCLIRCHQGLALSGAAAVHDLAERSLCRCPTVSGASPSVENMRNAFSLRKAYKALCWQTTLLSADRPPLSR